MGGKRQKRACEVSAPDAEVFGALLLDLYRLAREESMAEFQNRVLKRLSEVLPFDAAWWGMSRLDRDLHSSYPFRLPAHFVEYWRGIRADDILAATVLAAPAVTVHFDAARMSSTPVFAAFSEEFGIRQALCTLLMNPTLNLTTFLSLYRFSPAPAFTVAERQLKQLLMPHLWAAWTSSWISQLVSAHAHSFSSNVTFAIADQKGVLHAAEPRFSELIHLDWPVWHGPELPEPIRRAMSGTSPFRGAHTVTRLIPACGLILVEVRQMSPLDRLTEQELRIAERFGSGKSYKEIAAGLSVAPSTVRAHLRAVYTKLAISDNPELATLLSAHSSARHPAPYN